MTRQPHLYDDSTATIRSRQLRLFDPNAAEAGDSDLSCSVCGSYLIATDGYYACPRGHGRLLAEYSEPIDQERSGLWSDDEPLDAA